MPTIQEQPQTEPQVKRGYLPAEFPPDKQVAIALDHACRIINFILPEVWSRGYTHHHLDILSSFLRVIPAEQLGPFAQEVQSKLIEEERPDQENSDS